MEELSIYLNDHFAGATGGLELAKRAAGANEDNEYGAVLGELVEELTEERESLRGLIEELGFSVDRVKAGGGWVAEKFGRLKLNGSLLSYSPLSRLIELEGLTIGVTGKLSMWRNVRASVGPQVESVDLDALITRAESQLARLDPLRTSAAAEAFAPVG
jgi:hypothetical protein